MPTDRAPPPLKGWAGADDPLVMAVTDDRAAPEVHRGHRNLRLLLLVTAGKAWVFAGLMWWQGFAPWLCVALALAYTAACLAVLAYYRARPDRLGA